MIKEKYVKNRDMIVPIRYDEMFKAVFGNSNYPNITAYLISILTGIPYSLLKGKIVFKNTNNNLLRVKDKKIEKDVIFIVDLKEPLKINLEMNNRKYLSKEYIDRNLYYGSNFFGMGLEEKEDYLNIKTTIQYNFNLNYIDKINKDNVDEYVFRNKYGRVLTEKFKIVHINIEELSKLWYSEARFNYPENYQILCGISALMMCTEKEKFTANIDKVPLDFEIRRDIERIVEEMNYDDQLPERYYNREEEWARIDRSIIRGEKKRQEKLLKEKLEEGLALGIEQGAKERNIEIAKNMLNKKMDISLISDLTQLSIDEINDLNK